MNNSRMTTGHSGHVAGLGGEWVAAGWLWSRVGRFWVLRKVKLYVVPLGAK